MSRYPERTVCLTEETTESTYIVQPGPAALTEGVRQLHALLARVVGADPAASPMPDPGTRGGPEGQGQKRPAGSGL
jgi:hypothetical protein